MAIVQVGDSIYNASSKSNLDAKYGPYESVEEAKNSDYFIYKYKPAFAKYISDRAVGTTIGVYERNSTGDIVGIKEYWCTGTLCTEIAKDGEIVRYALDFVPKKSEIDIDTEISTESVNPVQNKVIYNYIENKIGIIQNTLKIL